MAMPETEILNILKENFPDAQIELKDLMNDQNHYSLKITSPDFKGLSRVQQHQMVYKALGPKMGYDLHALALTTSEK